MDLSFKIIPMSTHDAAIRWGTRLGIEMIIAFSLYVAAFRYSYFFGTLSLIIMAYIPLHAIFDMFFWRFAINRGHKNFLQTMGMGFMLFMYAILLTSVAYFIYFQFLDHGMLMQEFQEKLAEEDVRQSMTQIFPPQYIEQSDEAMQQLMGMTPIQLTIQLMTMNYTMCIPVVLIGALIVNVVKMPSSLRKVHEMMDKNKSGNMNS